MGASPGTVIPFDYAAKFELTGRPGNLVQDVINISSDGVFVAVAIGYGFEEDRARPIGFGNLSQLGPPTGFVVPGDITLGQIPTGALIEGFRLSPRFQTGGFSFDRPVAAPLVGEAFERVKQPEDISFLFSIVDSATGRELQDEPTHNLASLGKSNGERPFRLFAKPIPFLPRSTVRLQIIERSRDAVGTLFVVLYGYKMLAASNCPEPVVRSLASTAYPSCALPDLSGRVIPFDYAASFSLTGQEGNVLEDEIIVNVEGGFVATALGYGLAVEETGVKLIRPAELKGVVSLTLGNPAPSPSGTLTNVATGSTVSVAGGGDGRFVVAPLAPGEWDLTLTSPTITPVRLRLDAGTSVEVNIIQTPQSSLIRVLGALATFDLANLPIRLLPSGAILDGIRVKPNFVRLAFDDNGRLASRLPVELADQIFERLNRPEDVSFRYTVFDGGRGIELQNRPINNVAGLGIANGDRPFKTFPRPLAMMPRATLRVSVEERFGRGRLYLVFQGYKVLSAASTG
jgi:hypothetical protein